MNERIRELYIQTANETADGKEWAIGGLHNVEKFTKLIVQECVGVVEGGRFLHDQAPTAIFARECSHAIKRHFGVE